MLRGPKPQGNPSVVAPREPHPDDYWTGTDLVWTFELERTTPSLYQTQPGEDVSLILTRAGEMVISDRGVLGFAPKAIGETIKRVAEEVTRELGHGFRVSGCAKIEGRVVQKIEVPEIGAKVEIVFTLRQRHGEPEVELTERMRGIANGY